MMCSFPVYGNLLRLKKFGKGTGKRGQVSLFIEKHRNLCVKISRGCRIHDTIADATRRANWCSHGRAPESWIPGTPGAASTGVIGPAPLGHMRIVSSGAPFDIEIFFFFSDPIMCAVSSLSHGSVEKRIMRFLIVVYYILPCLIAIHTYKLPHVRTEKIHTWVRRGEFLLANKTIWNADLIGIYCNGSWWWFFL